VLRGCCGVGGIGVVGVVMLRVVRLGRGHCCVLRMIDMWGVWLCRWCLAGLGIVYVGWVVPLSATVFPGLVMGRMVGS